MTTTSSSSFTPFPTSSSSSPPPSHLSSPSSPPRRRTAVPVPLLLESFPVPPSHIPPSPAPPSSPNPPPTRPPSVPLPPLPDRDSSSSNLLFLSSSASSRSRRASKLSLSSVSTHDPTSPKLTSSRDSIASISSRSIRSFSSSRSNGPPPSIAFSITEHLAGFQHDSGSLEQLTRITVSPMPPLSDLDEDPENVLRIPLLQSSFSRRPTPSITSDLPSPHPDDSIASIDMRDLPPAEDEDEDDDIVPGTNGNVSSNGDLSNLNGFPSNLDTDRSSLNGSNVTFPSSQGIAFPGSETDIDADDARALHLHMRATRSRSESHKHSLKRRKASIPAPMPSQIQVQNQDAADPNITPKQEQAQARTPSPDIADILSSSTRSRRRSRHSSSAWSGSRSQSRSNTKSSHNARRASSPYGQSHGEGYGDEADAYGGIDMHIVDTDTARSTSTRGDASAFVREGGVDGHRHRHRNHGGHTNGDGDDDGHLDETALAQLERDLEGDGDSDSSLDLHTPLPHLMLRHGLLSPNSKLLPRSTTTPLLNNRPGSTMSVLSTTASIMTKSGILKDERDTPKRRVRHRDGKMLRGGIGLTTGLGWSDSEDEDAPSPLTRRISSLNLSRRSSASSIQSSAHPLSRSYSSVPEEDEDEWRPQRTPHSSLPPIKNRTSTSSLALAIPSSSKSTPGRSVQRSASESSSQLRKRQQEHGREHLQHYSEREHEHEHEQHDHHLHHEDMNMVRTPSSASTTSIPMPSTPQDAYDPRPSTSNYTHNQSHYIKQINKEDKVLPPLPTLRHYPSSISVRAQTGHPHTPASGIKPGSIPRSRTYSSASSRSASSAGKGSQSPSSLKAPPSVPVMPSTPRPLRLPQARSASSGDRPAVPVPMPSPSSHPPPPPSSFSYSYSGSHSSSGSGLKPLGIRPPSLPSSPTTPPASGQGSKPKPRTGTGMVYRTTSYSGLRPTTMTTGSPGGGGAGGTSRLRMPSSSLSSSSPRASTVPRPIAL